MAASTEPTSRALLPKNIIPSVYDIELTPNLTQFTFTGRETIDVEVQTSTADVVIHCLDIRVSATVNVKMHRKSNSNSFTVQVTTVSFTDANGKSYSPKEIDYQVKDETVTFHFESPLQVSPHFFDRTCFLVVLVFIIPFHRNDQLNKLFILYCILYSILIYLSSILYSIIRPAKESST